MSIELTGALSRAAAPERGKWIVHAELSDNPYIKDRKEAALPENRCAVFTYTRPDALSPSYHAYTEKELLNKDVCSLLDCLGINADLRREALNLFKADNIVALNPPKRDVAEEPSYRQMAATAHLQLQRG